MTLKIFPKIEFSINFIIKANYFFNCNMPAITYLSCRKHHPQQQSYQNSYLIERTFPLLLESI